MDLPHPQPDHNIEVQRFLNFLEYDQSSIDRESPIPCTNFTPQSALKSYFDSDRGSLTRLLRVVIKEEEDVPDTETVTTSYLSVFAILLSIGYGSFLPRFIEWDYSDSKLPFEQRPQHFPVIPNVSLFDVFAANQWRFCPQVLERRLDNKQVGAARVLPVVFKKQLKQCTSATIYQVVLHEDYDQLQERGDVLHNVLEASKKRRHTYIFKVFSGGHGYHAYDKERAAFRHLQQQNSRQLGQTIIGFYGSFTDGESHTLILEYADRGTLGNFLDVVPAPTSAEEIMRLWESILTIQYALYVIHGIPTDSLRHSDATKEYSALRGWHSDLKPHNILVVSGQTDSIYDCKFRLADLGTSHFERLAASGQNIKASDATGTKEFGAPESCKAALTGHRPLVYPQKADIWSLGCVYSEFAVWIVEGRDGLRKFREGRKQETKGRKETDEGCFHDGEKMLKCVKHWNERAFQNKRNSDHVTRSVLRKLIDEMLHTDPDTRPTAKMLIHKANDIFEKARSIERVNSIGSDSTDYLAARLRPKRKWQRPPSEDADHSSSDDSETPAVPSPSRQSTDTNDTRVYPHPSLNTIVMNNRLRGTPRTSDVELETRDTISGSSSSARHHREKRGSTYNKRNSKAGQGKYLPELTQSPDSRLQPALPTSAREERSYEDYLDDIVDPQSSISQENEKRKLDCITQEDGDEDLGQMIPLLRLNEPPNAPPPPPLQTSGENISKAHKPSLSLDRGLIYQRTKKANRLSHRLQDEGCLETLADPERDFVFIIDDSASMRRYKDKVYETVQFLAWLLKEYDKDGIDLYFLRARGKYGARARNSSDLLPHVKEKMRSCEGTSDVINRLGKILYDYRGRWNQSRQPKRFSIFQSARVKPMCIYVLTDGEWELGSDPRELLRDTAAWLETEGAPKNQLGIQFIRFGDKLENKRKLERLDSGLEAARDMIDTEPIDGNVFKMLLGPISRLWDDY